MSDVLTRLPLEPILHEPVDYRFKAFPSKAGVTVGTVGQQGWRALDGDLLLPVLLLRERAMQHNIDLMAGYCRRHGVSLAPHGKTPMAPQVVQRQLDAGAWGITTATVAEARVFRTFGVNRIILANELLEEAGLRWAASEMARDLDFQFACLVDSVTGIERMDGALGQVSPVRQVPVLVEMGVPGGRSGVRSIEEGIAVAEAVERSPYLQLIGVEGYEGAVHGDTLEGQLAGVDRFLGDMRTLTEQLAERGFFTGLEEIIVTAGGSKFFDRVVAILAAPWDLPVRVVLRSGAYVAHDSDNYDQLSALGQRSTEPDRLQPALELWGMVLSRPEPDLAIVGFGKRDSSYDIHLPLPFARRRGGVTTDLAGQATVKALNDQHAFVRLAPGCDLQVGDLLGCGISHPCTIFDKWQLVPLVDDEYRVTGAIRTFF